MHNGPWNATRMQEQLQMVQQSRRSSNNQLAGELPPSKSQKLEVGEILDDEDAARVYFLPSVRPSDLTCQA